MKSCTFFLFCAFLVCGQTVMAQRTDGGTIRGTLTDSLTGVLVPFATVTLLTNDKTVSGGLTDSLGHFRLTNLPYGTHTLLLSAVGYRTVRIPGLPLTPQQPAMELGIIAAGQDINQLKAVTVRGQRPLIEQHADGITYHVENLPAIAGSTASDVLRTVPMLSVDPNGGLSMRGSSNIRVFIDGKPSNIYASSVAEALRAIPGESIAKVEVITHPSARYDAEGTDGVVNIITRKLRENLTNGNVSGMLGNRSEMLMADMQRKRDKWLLKLDGFYQTYRNRNGSVLNRESDTSGIIQENESRQTGKYLFGGANLMFSPDSLRTISLGYRLRWTPNETSSVSDHFGIENVASVPGPGRPAFRGPAFRGPAFRRQTFTPFRSSGHTFTAGYTAASRDRRKEFSLLGAWALADGENAYRFDQTADGQPSYRENFNSRSQNRELFIQADYVRTFARGWKWETGGKFTQKHLDSQSRFGIYDAGGNTYRDDPARSTRFSYGNTVYALYSSFSFRHRNWQFISGLRYEHTLLRAHVKDAVLPILPFRNILPNLLVSRTLDPESTLKASYTVKLVRPFYGYLDPTVNYSDSLNLRFGNPGLRPEITRRYQLSYTRTTDRWLTDLTLFYNHNRNSIEAIRTARPDGVFEHTWQNVGRNKRLGVSATLGWKPTARTNLNTTLTVQQVYLRSPAMQLSNSGLMRQLVINYSQKLARGYGFDFYGFFDADNLQLQGYRTGWKYYSLTFSKQSAGKRFNISLRMDTPLTRFTYIKEYTSTASHRQHYTYRYQNRNIRLTLAYKLGKKEIRSPRMRQIDPE